MSAGNIDVLLDLWAASLFKHHDTPPFANHSDLYDTIDATPLSDVPWDSFSMSYNGPLPESNVPSWMTAEFDIWFRDPRTVVRNMLSNPDFNGEFDEAPRYEFNMNGKREYQDFMLADWAWKQAVRRLPCPNFIMN